MKRFRHLFAGTATLLFALLWLNCNGDNPTLDLDDPATLVGTYDLVSVTDKAGVLGPSGISYNAGEATQVVIQGTTVTVTLTGTLVLTESTFTLTFNGLIEVPGVPPDMQTDVVNGTYSISGSVITFTDSEGSISMSTISIDGNRLTIDDSVINIVFEKQ